MYKADYVESDKEPDKLGCQPVGGGADGRPVSVAQDCNREHRTSDQSPVDFLNTDERWKTLLGSRSWALEKQLRPDGPTGLLRRIIRQENTRR